MKYDQSAKSTAWPVATKEHPLLFHPLGVSRRRHQS